MRALVIILAAIVVCAAAATSAYSSSSMVYGLQDDAWLEFGPGKADERVAALQGVGVRMVRLTVRWDEVEAVEGTYDWTGPDAVLDPLRAAGIGAVVTLYGTPRWANGGKAPNVAPLRAADFARFAGAAAARYPDVGRWTVWNEPNQRRWLSTASPAQYVARLLNPAYAAIHDVSPSSRVAGGVTAPRGAAGGTSPVAFIRGMGRAGARLDAYAHHPYRDEPGLDRWQSGLETVGGVPKPALGAFEAPLAQVTRRGLRTTLWGAVRNGAGARPYVLQRLTASGWRSLGGEQRTRADGTLGRVVQAATGSKLRLLVGDRPGNELVVR